jgi:hypothetical protein
VVRVRVWGVGCDVDVDVDVVAAARWAGVLRDGMSLFWLWMYVGGSCGRKEKNDVRRLEGRVTIAVADTADTVGSVGENMRAGGLGGSKGGSHMCRAGTQVSTGSGTGMREREQGNGGHGAGNTRPSEGSEVDALEGGGRETRRVQVCICYCMGRSVWNCIRRGIWHWNWN